MDETDIAALRQMAIGLTTYEAELIEDIIADDARLRAALVEHNDMLRSAFQAAQRDAAHDTAGTTNFNLLADRLSEVLSKHHAVANAARRSESS